MTILHHPHEATLMSFAAGSLSEPLSAVVAAHRAMCAQCDRDIRRFEDIGSAVLMGLPAADMAHPVPAISAVPSDAHAHARAAALQRSAERGDVPGPLVAHVGSTIDGIQWRRLGFGVWHLRLPLSRHAEGDLRLLRIAPGRVMPEHGHGGAELTLVLRGAYRDERGEFRAGDVSDLDADIEHCPVAHERDGCICLVGSDSKVRFKRLIDKLVQPLTGM